jgi:hypothetical protein
MKIAGQHHIITLLISISLSVSSGSHASEVDQSLITDDGREVLLNRDGTWKYLSTDRFVDTKDGQRVRLKEDGSWSYIGNAPITTDKQVRTTDLDIRLQKVVIETHKKKVQKNSKIKTQTVFYVNLAYSPRAKNNITIKESDMNLVEVKDNNGKRYPVLSIKPVNTQIKPDTETTIIIRAKKSPLVWDSVKTMDVIFKKEMFGLKSPVTLSQRTDDFEEKNVDGFE